MIIPNVHHPHLRSLHRSFLREIKQLPTNYLRQFFRIKVRDDLRALSQQQVRNYDSKLKRVTKELRKLTAANNGNVKAFGHVLDTAYGRKGKLKWELMEPLLSDPSAPLPERIIPAEEKSRPPTYSPELTALLNSPNSHTTRPLTPKALKNPPTLPERADPQSQEALMVGPLSKRREVNIRWRFFTAEWKKVLPPLHVVVEEKDKSYETVDTGHDSTSLARASIRGFGLQGTDVLEEIKAMAGPPYKTCTPAPASVDSSGQNPPSTHKADARPITNRFIRRRYQELLGRLPILTYSHRNNTSGGSTGLGYRVSLAPSAISKDTRYSPARIPDADQTDMEWITAADQKTPKRKTSTKAKAKNSNGVTAPD